MLENDIDPVKEEPVTPKRQRRSPLSNAQDDLAPQLPLLHSHVIRVDLDGSEVSPVIFVIHTASNNC